MLVEDDVPPVRAVHGAHDTVSETTSEDLDFCEYMDVTEAELEMRCPICLEVRTGTAGDFDFKQRWIVLQCCEDAVCRQCLRQHLQSNGNSCPLNASHRLQDMDVIAGCQSPEEWLKLEQRRRFLEAGARGFCCSSPSCAGLLPPTPAAAPWERQPFPTPCPGCYKAHCGRCGTPWPSHDLMERHLCEDLRHVPSRERGRVAGERVAQPLVDAVSATVTNNGHFNWVSTTVQTLVADAARERLDGVGLNALETEVLMHGLPTPWPNPTTSPELRLFHWLQEHRQGLGDGLGARPAGGAAEEDDELQRFWNFHQERMLRRRRHTPTMQALESQNAQRFQTGRGPVKNCPRCQHPTERVDGCNIMKCTLCHVDWCFVCGAAQAESVGPGGGDGGGGGWRDADRLVQL
ncbi:unnamed protein product [Durusdinium trenchii]|uniref:RBR-type E3 ubiquitin transferase n=1 Tax=Durusdinium trenchii TaxID=1381693 RepID=A0ABP0N8L5_9DINO